MHRLLGFATVLCGIMTFLALGSASLLAAPMAIAFAVTAFWWNLTRPGGVGAPVPSRHSGRAGAARAAASSAASASTPDQGAALHTNTPSGRRLRCRASRTSW